MAPIKIVTIPRLELCAMELGCKMLTKIREMPMLAEVPVFLWTDSEIALYWIRKPPSELKTFVANRVNRILQSITIDQSRHIASRENPADLLSRGVKVETLSFALVAGSCNTAWGYQRMACLEDNVSGLTSGQSNKGRA